MTKYCVFKKNRKSTDYELKLIFLGTHSKHIRLLTYFYVIDL